MIFLNVEEILLVNDKNITSSIFIVIYFQLWQFWRRTVEMMTMFDEVSPNSFMYIQEIKNFQFSML